MSEYTPFSQIMDGDGDGTWDDNLSGSGTQTRDDSKPSLIPLGTNSLPEAAPAEELPEKKPKHEEVTISTIEVEAEDQTIVSKISITSLRSRAGCFEMPTVLCENSSLDEGDVSEITEMRMEKPRPKEKKKDGVCVSLLDSCTGDRPLKMPSCISKNVRRCQSSMCISEKCVQYPSIADAYSPSLFEDIIQEEDEIAEVAEPPKQEEIPKDSNEAKTTEPEKPHSPPKTVGNGESSNATVSTKHVEQKSAPYNICFNGVTEPMHSIAEMLTSASNHFTSSSLSVDGDCSILFISANGDAQKQIVSVPTEMSAITLESPKSAREPVRPADRSLFDIMSHTSVIDEEDRTTTTIGENITEGLGLDLPPTPVAARPLITPETPKTQAPKTTPETPKTEDTLKTEDSNETTSEPEIADTDSTDMARIEVDASGTILLEDAMNQDVYISYQIEVVEHDDESTTESEDIATPIPPKTPSPSRKSLKPRWPKLFSSSKTKKNKKDNKNNGIVKPASKELCDSPGSATVGTAETQMTMRTYATLNFAEDHPVNPRKHPFFLRPRSTTKA